MEMKNLGSYNRCLLLFICLINFSGLFSAVPVSPNSIDSVLVEKFIWDAETDIRVSCSNFELYLSYTGYMLYDNSEINRLQKEMSVLPSSESEYVDTRCKIFFFRADTVVYTACIGRFTALIDGNMYRSTERLFNTIDSLITGKPQIRNIVHADKDIIISGEKAIISLLKEMACKDKAEDYFTDGRFLFAICFVSPAGKTVDVKLVDSMNWGLTDDEKERFIESFKEMVVWEPSKERTKKDDIWVRIGTRGIIPVKSL